MAHHSSDDPFQNEAMQELRKITSDGKIRKLLETTAALGPTDQYPEGKIAPQR